MLLPRTSSPVVRLLLLSSSSVLVAHISCLSHIYHRLVADQLFSGYLSCLSHRSVLVAHLLYPLLAVRRRHYVFRRHLTEVQ